MGNTKAGGKATANTNKIKYGSDYYSVIGSEGGRHSNKPFRLNKRLARRASMLGHKARYGDNDNA